MPLDTLALILWSLLAASLILSLWGMFARSSTALFVAAGLAIVFGIAAIFSIGILVLALAAVQLTGAIALRCSSRDA